MTTKQWVNTQTRMLNVHVHWHSITIIYMRNAHVYEWWCISMNDDASQWTTFSTWETYARNMIANVLLSSNLSFSLENSLSVWSQNSNWYWICLQVLKCWSVLSALVIERIGKPVGLDNEFQEKTFLQPWGHCDVVTSQQSGVTRCPASSNTYGLRPLYFPKIYLHFSIFPPK